MSYLNMCANVQCFHGIESRYTALSRMCCDRERGLISKWLAQIHMLWLLPPVWASWKGIYISSFLSVGERRKYVGQGPSNLHGLTLTNSWHSHVTSLAWLLTVGLSWWRDWKEATQNHFDAMRTGSFRNIWDQYSWHEHWPFHDR